MLRYYEVKLTKLRDAGLIVGQIKQAKLGNEHLLMMTSYHSANSSRVGQSFRYDPILHGGAYGNASSIRESLPVIPHISERSELDLPPISDHVNSSEASQRKILREAVIKTTVNPFGRAIETQEPIEIITKADHSGFDDSRSDVMTEHAN